MDEEFITAIELEGRESGERIDALLASSIDELTRSGAQKLLEAGQVLLIGRAGILLPESAQKAVKKNYRVNSGDRFLVHVPPLCEVPLIPQEIPLDIVYEDSSLIVVNKQRGLVVHPAPGHPDGTLVNGLLFHCGDTLSGIGGEKRPGIVHRIDKDTSGLLIIAKNDHAHRFLSAQLSDHTLNRTYDAVINGSLKEHSGTVDRPIGRHPLDRKRMAVTDKNSRNAVTHWEKLTEYRGYTHISCRLETGRTHQIRVHMASIGHPLLGDGLYGAKCPDKGLEGQCLHASRIRFIHPDTLQPMELTCPLPDYFTQILSKLVIIDSGNGSV